MARIDTIALSFHTDYLLRFFSLSILQTLSSISCLYKNSRTSQWEKKYTKHQSIDDDDDDDDDNDFLF